MEIKLTDKQKEIFQLTALGKTNDEIAMKLGKSNGLITGIRRTVMDKYNFYTVTGACCELLRRGLID